ncbi:MAG: hypothetical protein PHQ43_14045, partial [Dehalococcoidales bacterium]|nr:hypothetical protein [Dehalococcoidales bacterium]
DVTVSGNTISITALKAGPYDTVTTETSRGDGTVKGVFDIDHGNVINGKTPNVVANVVKRTGSRTYKTGSWLTGYTDVTEYYTYYETVYSTEYHDYVITPRIELWFEDPLTSGSWSKVSESNSSAILDKGSNLLTDPFMEFDLANAGNYQIRVGAYKDYTDNSVFSDEILGVTSGLSYQLNVSLQRHDTNPNAIELVGKQVTFTSGAAIGQTVEIAGYNPETRRFQIGAVTQAPVTGDKFEIGYDLQSMHPDYTPVGDTYTIVLTSAPSEDVIIDVVPQATRTYNSDQAFNPDAGYGENEAVQIMAATPRAQIELTGTPANGETWTITLDGKVFSTASDGKTLEQIASDLGALIDGSGVIGENQYTATVTDHTILITAVITIDGVTSPENFYAEFSVTPETKGGYEIAGSEGAIDGWWQEADVELTDQPSMNEIWSIVLDGTHYDYTAGFREDLSDVAQALGDMVDDTPDNPDDTLYDVFVKGRVISIKRIDGTDFTASVVIVPDSLGSATVIPQLVFTAGNWDTPQTVHVKAVDDNVIDGSDAIVFPGMEGRVNAIRGPLTVNGGIQVSEEIFLENPFTLPGESNWPMADGYITSFGSVNIDGVNYITLTDTGATHVDPRTGLENGFDPRLSEATYEFTIIDGDARGLKLDVMKVHDSDPYMVIFKNHPDELSITPRYSSDEAAADHYYFAPVNPNYNVVEEDQVDILNVFHTNSVSNDTGTLTSDRLYGLGMGPDTVIGGKSLEGGITYLNIESFNLELGSGIDTFTIESTHKGSTAIKSGAGNDNIKIETIDGHTTVETGDGNDSVHVGTNGLIDQITGLLTLVGGAGSDTVTIDDSSDTNDNRGVLTQTELTGLDMASVPEIQTVSVRAQSGTYKLRSAGFGTNAGLADSAYVTRDADSAVVTLDYSMTEAEVQAQLEELYGTAGVHVDAVTDGHTIIYRISAAGELAGLNLPALEWAENINTTGLAVGDLDISA